MSSFCCSRDGAAICVRVWEGARCSNRACSHSENSCEERLACPQLAASPLSAACLVEYKSALSPPEYGSALSPPVGGRGLGGRFASPRLQAQLQ